MSAAAPITAAGRQTNTREKIGGDAAAGFFSTWSAPQYLIAVAAKAAAKKRAPWFGRGRYELKARISERAASRTPVVGPYAAALLPGPSSGGMRRDAAVSRDGDCAHQHDRAQSNHLCRDASQLPVRREAQSPVGASRCTIVQVQSRGVL